MTVTIIAIEDIRKVVHVRTPPTGSKAKRKVERRNEV
jgi:hypothetical protein